MLLAVAFTATTMCSCVDERYSFDNIEMGDISIGNVITTPPITASISLEGLLGGMSEIEKILEANGLTLEDIGVVGMYLGDQSFTANLPLDVPLIPESMVSIFDDGSEGSKVEMLMDISSTLPMEMIFELEFTDATGRVITGFNDITLAKAENGQSVTFKQSQDITRIIGDLSAIKGINISLRRPTLDKVVFELNNYVSIKMRIEKTGGIKL